jgi:hypothetical protein
MQESLKNVPYFSNELIQDIENNSSIQPIKLEMSSCERSVYQQYYVSHKGQLKILEGVGSS